MTGDERALLIELSAAHAGHGSSTASPEFRVILSNLEIAKRDAAQSPPPPMPSVPAELLARLPNADYLENEAAGLPDTSGCTIDASEVRGFAKLIRWARSQPAAPEPPYLQITNRDLNARIARAFRDGVEKGKLESAGIIGATAAEPPAKPPRRNR